MERIYTRHLIIMKGSLLKINCSATESPHPVIICICITIIIVYKWALHFPTANVQQDQG